MNATRFRVGFNTSVSVKTIAVLLLLSTKRAFLGKMCHHRMFLCVLLILSSGCFSSRYSELRHQLNSAFESSLYGLECFCFQALLFWAAVPVLWLLLTLLIFLVYFCLRCCQREPEKKGRGTCLPWTLAILALLTW